VPFPVRVKITVKTKLKVRGDGHECPSHACTYNIKINVKSSGQECPLHTIKINI
jgi:hypothetical protein